MDADRSLRSNSKVKSQKSKEKRIQSPKFVYGKQKEMSDHSGVALLNTASLLQAPEFIYGA